MEQKELYKLSVKGLEELVEYFDEIDKNGCGGMPCDKCLSSRSAWKEFAGTGEPCRNVRKKARELLDELKSGTVSECTETLDTIQITPETTKLNNLIESGYIHQLAGVFQDQGAIAIYCSNTNCDSCKLHQRNYSTDLPHTGCKEPREYIMAVSRFLRTYGEVKPKKTKTCINCGYYKKNGEYHFCTAWNNFTTEDMYCDYHKPLDE